MNNVKLLGRIFTSIFGNSIIQVVVNGALVFYVNTYCSAAVTSNGIDWISLFRPLVVFLIINILFLVGNKTRNITFSKIEAMEYIQRKGISRISKERCEHLLDVDKKKQLYLHDLDSNVQPSLCVLCDAIVDSIKIFYNTREDVNKMVEIIIYLVIDEKIKPFAFSGNEAPKAFSKEVYDNYSQAIVLKNNTPISYLNKREIIQNFVYIGANDEEIKKKHNEERARQYLAIPIRARLGDAIGVLQIVSYDNLIKKRDKEFIMDSIIETCCDYAGLIISEQLAFEKKVK